MNNEPVAWMYEDASGTMKMLGNTRLEEWVTKFGCKEIPLYTHPAKADKYIADLKNLVDAQGQDGTWNSNQYMLGLFNGLEFALSIFESREPKFRELTAKTLTDEEIISIADDYEVAEYRVCDFARAILKKAIEK